MMYAPPLREMLFIHFFLGISLCLWAILHARKYDKKRSLFQFGNGWGGESKKWIQWFSWALTFEIITSLLYMHTGLFYYEVAMSPFEALAFVIGAFVLDRFFDIFMGEAEINLPKPKINIDLSSIKERLNKIQDTLTPKPTAKVEPTDHNAEEKAKLDELLKGH